MMKWRKARASAGLILGVAGWCAVGCGATLLAQPTRAQRPGAVTPAEHHRGEEQTFLTFPEWYLVYAPAEFARFLSRDGAPSRFPYLKQVVQYWRSYSIVNRRVQVGGYPQNSEYQVMLWVIGVSTTVEYAVREAYERIVARPFEHTRFGGPTAEEQLGARVAQEYVDVILDRPWYEYDFLGALKRLWVDTPYLGADMLRKLERRYALTTEWLAKAIYAKAIKLANESANEAPLPVTAVRVTGLNRSALAAIPEAEVLRQFNREFVLLLPRYAAFKHSAQTMANHGADFIEIAGNRNAITLCALVRPGFEPAVDGAKVMLRQALYTERQHERVLVEVPVAELGSLLRELKGEGYSVEHLFDY